MEAKEFNPEVFVIARSERDGDTRRLERAGAQRILCPYKSGGRETLEFITRPGVADFIADALMGGGGVALAQIRVQEGAGLARTFHEHTPQTSQTGPFGPLSSLGSTFRILPSSTGKPRSAKRIAGPLRDLRRGSLLHCLRGQNPQSPARKRVDVPGARLHEMFGLGAWFVVSREMKGGCLPRHFRYLRRFLYLIGLMLAFLSVTRTWAYGGGTRHLGFPTPGVSFH
ncbi:MAG: hypothetical protein ACI9X4_001509 [Glaciecola sp.]|jgi:hypothetical protein